MFRAVRTPRVYEHIVAQIERAIYEGRLAHGDKLPPERQLVREFGASRVAVREALRALEHRGLVEVRQGSAGGYFIRELDATTVVRDLSTLFRLGRVSLAQVAGAAARNPVHAAVTHALTALEVKVVAQGVDLTSEDDAAIIAAHLLIHDAIARRDGDAARAAMHAHILDVERRLARGGVARAAS